MSRESQYTHFEDKIQDQISIVSTVSTVKLAHFWVNFQFFLSKMGLVYVWRYLPNIVYISLVSLKKISLRPALLLLQGGMPSSRMTIVI